ncbi:MAG: hypothetical protein Q7L55_11780 [Actinomycetota bacterium]|nr:hypothetical protein [Actinomycetota bacterium]
MGFFAGVFLGLGVALLLFVFGVIPVTIVWLAILGVGGIVIGIVLGYVLPRKSREQQPPTVNGTSAATA